MNYPCSLVVSYIDFNFTLCRFCYEAAVCGGIPVINALQTDFVADEITNVMGIMNGQFH